MLSTLLTKKFDEAKDILASEGDVVSPENAKIISTVILAATRSNDIDTIKFLVPYADLSANHYSELSIAVLCGHNELFMWICECMSRGRDNAWLITNLIGDLNTTTSPLYYAAVTDNRDCFEWICKKMFPLKDERDVEHPPATTSEVNTTLEVKFNPLAVASYAFNNLHCDVMCTALEYFSLGSVFSFMSARAKYLSNYSALPELEDINMHMLRGICRVYFDKVIACDTLPAEWYNAAVDEKSINITEYPYCYGGGPPGGIRHDLPFSPLEEMVAIPSHTTRHMDHGEFIRNVGTLTGETLRSTMLELMVEWVNKLLTVDYRVSLLMCRFNVIEVKWC